MRSLAREPEMERDIGVARRQRQVVIVALARGRVAAVGLHRDDELAEPHEAEAERAVDAARGSSAGSPHAATSARLKSAGVAASRPRIRRASASARAALPTSAAISAGASQSRATSYPAARRVSAMATALAGVSSPTA